jgi:hypothetical protein
MHAPDPLLTLAQLGQHSTAVRQQAQTIAVAVLIHRETGDAARIEADIAALAADCESLCTALRRYLAASDAD